MTLSPGTNSALTAARSGWPPAWGAGAAAGAAAAAVAPPSGAGAAAGAGFGARPARAGPLRDLAVSVIRLPGASVKLGPSEARSIDMTAATAPDAALTAAPFLPPSRPPILDPARAAPEALASLLLLRIALPFSSTSAWPLELARDRISEEMETSWPACRSVSKPNFRTAFPPPCSTFVIFPSTISPWSAGGPVTRPDTRSPLWLVPVHKAFISSTCSCISWA